MKKTYIAPEVTVHFFETNQSLLAGSYSTTGLDDFGGYGGDDYGTYDPD